MKAKPAMLIEGDRGPIPVYTSNRCEKCGKKHVAETIRDERDADALCWCSDDDEQLTTPAKGK